MSEQVKCSGCKWWGNGEKPIVGFSEGAKKWCGRLQYGFNREDSMVYLEDGDYASSNGSLWTEPDFYCALATDE